MSSPQTSAWNIAYPQKLKYSFFLSHVGEDAGDMKRLKRALSKEIEVGLNPLPPFLDREDWPEGTSIIPTLREEIVHSEFFVVWITPSFLENTRGWVWMELALAQLVEDSLNTTQFGNRFSFVLPIFRDITLTEIESTPLLELWTRPLVSTKEKISMPILAQRLLRHRSNAIVSGRPLDGT